MKKHTKGLLYTLGGTAVIAPIIWASVVLNYGKPDFHQGTLDYAHRDANRAANHFDEYRTYVIESTPGRKEILSKIDSLDYELDNGGNKAKIAKEMQQLEDLESKLVNDRLNNNKVLNHLEQEMNHFFRYEEQLQRDSAICDSISRIPVKKRFNDNWTAMRIKRHQDKIMYHQKKLKQLQK